MEPLFHKKGAQGRSMIGLTYLARDSLIPPPNDQMRKTGGERVA